RGAPPPPCCGQRDPEQPVPASNSRSSAGTLQRYQLLPQCQVFKNQFVVSTAGQRDAAGDDKNVFNKLAILPLCGITNQSAAARFDCGEHSQLFLRITERLPPLRGRYRVASSYLSVSTRQNFMTEIVCPT